MKFASNYIGRNIGNIHITLHFDWKRFELYWSDHSLPDDEIVIHTLSHINIDRLSLKYRAKTIFGTIHTDYEHGDIINKIINIAKYGSIKQLEYPLYPNKELEQYFEQYFETDLQYLIGV